MIKRPLLFGVVAFVAGMSIERILHMTMGVGMAVGLILFGLVWFRFGKKGHQYMPFFVCVICGLLGVINGYRCEIPDAYSDNLDRYQGGQAEECEITGRVKRIEEQQERRVLLVQTDGIQGDGYRMTAVYMVRIYDTTGETLRIGDEIQAQIRLWKPQEPTNPGEFNSAVYYRARGIDFLGSIQSLVVYRDGYAPVRRWLVQLKMQAQSVFDATLPEREAGIMNAMLLGDTGEMDAYTKKLYQRNGIAHILAISGLHLSILGSTFYRLLRRLHCSYIGAGIPVILLLAAYGWLTGFSGSTVRAVIMFVLMIGGDMLGRTYDTGTALGLACLIILIENPWRLLDAGFWLSFGAVFTFGMIVPIVEEWFCQSEEEHRIKNGNRKTEKRRRHWRGRLAKALRTGMILQLLTGPIVLYFYYEYPIYSVFLNLVVVPLVTPIVICGLLGLILYPIWPFLSGVVLLPCRWVLQIFFLLCQIVDRLPGSVWHAGEIKLWQLGVYYGLLILFGMAYRYRRRLAPVAVLGLVVLMLFRKEGGQVRIVMLDVGQGDGILIETPGGSHVLMDGGSSSRSTIGEYVILPALRYYGSRTLDYVFVSHMDEDHVNGIQELIGLSVDRELTIRYLVVPKLAQTDREFQELLVQAEKAGIRILLFDAGEELEVDCVTFQCLYPVDGEEEMENTDKNNRSMVIAFRYRHFRMLFTGDLEAAGEAELIKSLRECEELYDYDVLKVGHHGSSGASSEAFLDAVRPVIGMISCGRNNRYGHPHEETLERLETAGVRWYCTKEVGAVILTSDGADRMSVYGYLP